MLSSLKCTLKVYTCAKSVKGNLGIRFVSLASSIEGALRDKLAAAEVAESASHYRPLRSFKGEGLLPGVDLMDSRALSDRMDEIH
ncbi:MAG: hypothetical protein WCQ50_04355 [Spirochaetota bacterium]